MNTITIIMSCAAIFSCSVTHEQWIYMYIFDFFGLSVPKPDADFSANQRQTQSDVARQTHLTAPTPVCQGVIDSAAQQQIEWHHQTISQECSTLRSLNQPHQQSGGKPESIQQGGRLPRFSQPPPRTGSGRERSNCLWKRKKMLLLRFLWAIHVMKIHFTSACMCSRACARARQREYYLPGQKLYN